MTSKALREQMARTLTSRDSPNSSDAVMSQTVFGQLNEEAALPVDIPISKIRISRFQRRANINREYIENLAERISIDGLNNAIIVRPIPGTDEYEHVAGFNRIEAFKLLGRDRIPARIRHYSDSEAARSLTVDNTNHSLLSDWELYLHIEMLREARAFKNHTELASILNKTRAAVYQIEAFGVLPAKAKELIQGGNVEIGAKMAYDIRGYCEAHPDLVVTAIELVAAGKLKQSAAAGWIERSIHKPAPPPARRELRAGADENMVRCVVTDAEAKISGNLDYDKLWALIQAHLPELQKGDSVNN